MKAIKSHGVSGRSGIEGEAILSDFCDSKHVTSGCGTSGSGKSEWLKTLVASLVHRNPPEHLRLALVDRKCHLQQHS